MSLRPKIASIFFSAILTTFWTLAIAQEYEGIRCQSDLKRIQNESLPTYTLEDLAGLVFERKGATEDSNMTALGLHIAVKKDKLYRLSEKGIQEVEAKMAGEIGEGERGIIELELMPNAQAAPPYLEIEAQWDKSISHIASEANILGGNGRLIFDKKEISIPVVEASDQNLAYYGAKVLQMGDVVKFPDEEFPIWVMKLGQNYVRDYIMVKGGGLYVEYHNDRPHFHMPLSEDGAGQYLLGKKVGENKFQFTAFRIPYGRAVYTCKGVIHCDAALTGRKWIVGYTNAKDFSTVLLRTNTDEAVKINFLE